MSNEQPEFPSNRVHEKFSRAAHELVTGTGNVQQRIADAGYHIFAAFIDEGLPKDMLESYRGMYAELTKVVDTAIGSIRATALTLSDEDAQRWAGEINSMNEEIHRRLGIEAGLRQAKRG